MLRPLLLFLAFISLISCGGSEFVVAEHAPKLSANNLGVFYYYPSENVPKGAVLIGTWDYTDKSGKKDIQLQRILDKDARKRGANVVHLRNIKEVFGGQRLIAKYYYHDDLAAVRYHNSEMQNKTGLNRCDCAELHFFRYQKEGIKRIPNELDVLLNGKSLGKVGEIDTLIARIPIANSLNLSSGDSDTLKLKPKAGERYFIEIFEPQKSSIYFTGSGFMVLYYLNNDVMLVRRKGMLSRWRYDEFRQNILSED